MGNASTEHVYIRELVSVMIPIFTTTFRDKNVGIGGNQGEVVDVIVNLTAC